MERYTGPERRKHPRLNASFVISYKLKDIPDDSDLSQTRNVSQGGLLLTTNKQFDNGTMLAITIRFPFVLQKIEVTGEVVGSKEIVRDLLYETRIRFLDLDMDIFQKLGEFINERIK